MEKKKKDQIQNFWAVIGNSFLVNVFAGMQGEGCKSKVCQSCPHIYLTISLIPDPQALSALNSKHHSVICV